MTKLNRGSPMTDEMLASLRTSMERATPLPWAWEQCGDKCDDPVVGVIVDADIKPLSGCVEMYDENGDERGYYREGIAYEWHSCDGHSASANAAFVVEAVNALPTLLDRLSSLEEEKRVLTEALKDADAAIELTLRMHTRARDTVPDEDEGLASQIFAYHINHTDSALIQSQQTVRAALSAGVGR